MKLGINDKGEKIYSVSGVQDRLNELKKLKVSLKEYLNNCLEQGERDITFQKIKDTGYEIDNLKGLKVDEYDNFTSK